jgi:cathepsin H
MRAALLLLVPLPVLSKGLATSSSSCLDIKSREECIAGGECAWCECAAVPSECVDPEMAKKLPPSVFHCSQDSSPEVQMVETMAWDEVFSASDELFAGWKIIHSKEYETEEKEILAIGEWQKTLERVHRHNQDGTSTYWLEMNQFADISDAEFAKTFLGAMHGQNCSATHKPLAEYPGMGVVLPSHVDWREKGAVSPVKNQGKCGSCWTFSTTGSMESHNFLRTGEMVLLSEQQLVDCAFNFDNHGCSGGLPSHAFEYIASVGGLDTEATYQYTAVGGECQFDSIDVGATTFGSFNITFQDEKMLESAVGTVGPVSVAFQVTGDFKSYAGGVYDNPDCSTSPESVNHAVLCVGYGTDDETGLDYFIIKNSWGAEWGDEGYFKLRRGVNACGVADCASYPLM